MRAILPILTSRSSDLVLGTKAGLSGQSPAAGKAQNAAVRHICSAFKVQHNPNRTTPPTMGIPPVDLRLSLLIKNVALRMYRLPMNSQLVVAVSHAHGPRGTASSSEIGTVRRAIVLALQPRPCARCATADQQARHRMFGCSHTCSHCALIPASCPHLRASCCVHAQLENNRKEGLGLA
jgi:hypothetical protein